MGYSIEKEELIELSLICKEYKIDMKELVEFDSYDRNILISFYKNYYGEDKIEKIKEIINILKKWKEFAIKYKGYDEVFRKHDIVLEMDNRINQNYSKSNSQAVKDGPLIVYEIIKYIETLIDNDELLKNDSLVNAAKKDLLYQTKTILEFHKQKKIDIVYVLNNIIDQKDFNVFANFFQDCNYKNVSIKLAKVIKKSLELYIEYPKKEKYSFLSNMADTITKVTSNEKISIEQKNKILNAIADKMELYVLVWVKKSQTQYNLISIIMEFIKEDNQNDAEIYVSFLDNIIRNSYYEFIETAFISKKNKFEKYMIKSFLNVSSVDQISALREFQIDYIKQNHINDEEDKQKAEELFGNVSKAMSKSQEKNYISTIYNIALQRPNIPANVLDDISSILCKSKHYDEHLMRLENIIILSLDELTDNTDIETYNKIKEFITACSNLKDSESENTSHTYSKLCTIESIYEKGSLSLEDLIQLTNKINYINEEEIIDLIMKIAINAEQFTEDGLNEAISYVIEHRTLLPFDKLQEWLIKPTSLHIIMPNTEELCISKNTVNAFELYNYASIEEMKKLLTQNSYTNESQVELMYTIPDTKERTKTRLRDRKSILKLNNQ